MRLRYFRATLCVFFENSGINFLYRISVPSPQQKTLADYVEGILELDVVVDERKVKGSRRSLSPTLLRKKIEALKHSDSEG